MHRGVELLARTMALIGGIVLCLLIVLTTASVFGRLLNTLMHGPIGIIAPDFATFMLELGVGPINGDFELVEAESPSQYSHLSPIVNLPQDTRL